MSRPARLAAGAAVVLAVVLAVVPASGPRDNGGPAVTSSPADGATLPRAHAEVAQSDHGAGGSAPASGHQHDIDPVSAGLLVADGIAALAVVVLLMRRPRRPASAGR